MLLITHDSGLLLIELGVTVDVLGRTSWLMLHRCGGRVRSVCLAGRLGLGRAGIEWVTGSWRIVLGNTLLMLLMLLLGLLGLANGIAIDLLLLQYSTHHL